MTQQTSPLHRGGDIVHHQRLAWDCARAFVAVVDSDRDYFWLCDEVRRLLGPEYELALSDARTRLQLAARPDAPQIEAGLWRARMEDALRERPGLVPALGALVEETRQRADSLSPIG
jgi:hypothetical protein